MNAQANVWKIKEKVYGVESASNPEAYHVVRVLNLERGSCSASCDCKGFQFNGRCRHIRAVAEFVGRALPTATEEKITEEEARRLLARAEPSNDFERESIKKITAKKEINCRACKFKATCQEYSDTIISCDLWTRTPTEEKIILIGGNERKPTDGDYVELI